MTDLDQLRALQAVARHGSVSAAADALHITTSAASQRLSKLEREVGQPLLERHGRTVRLTDAAVLLVQHADRILSILDEARADLEDHRGAVSGPLTVAAFPTAARGLLPASLRVLRERHPHVRVGLRELEPEEALVLVLRGDVDVAVVQDWFDEPLDVPPTLDRVDLLIDVCDLAVPVGHRLAEREYVDVAELAGEPWVTWPRGSLCHQWLTRTLRETGVDPSMSHTAEEHATQLAFVAADFGISMIPQLGRDQVPDGVALVPVRPAPRRSVYAVWRAETHRRLTVRAAVDALTSTAQP